MIGIKRAYRWMQERPRSHRPSHDLHRCKRCKAAWRSGARSYRNHICASSNTVRKIRGLVMMEWLSIVPFQRSVRRTTNTIVQVGVSFEWDAADIAADVFSQVGIHRCAGYEECRSRVAQTRERLARYFRSSLPFGTNSIRKVTEQRSNIWRSGSVEQRDRVSYTTVILPVLGVHVYDVDCFIFLTSVICLKLRS